MSLEIVGDFVRKRVWSGRVRLFGEMSGWEWCEVEGKGSEDQLAMNWLPRFLIRVQTVVAWALSSFLDFGKLGSWSGLLG